MSDKKIKIYVVKDEPSKEASAGSCVGLVIILGIAFYGFVYGCWESRDTIVQIIKKLWSMI